MANKKKNKKIMKMNPKSAPSTTESISDSLPSTAESISDSLPSTVNHIYNIPALQQSRVNPVSDSPPSPLSPRTPLPPDFFKNTVIVRSNDMSYKMRYETFDITDNAFKKHFLKDRDIAQEIKTEFDKRHGLNWHCVVGTSYVSYITYKKKQHIYFYMSGKAVLLFKHG
ncbi:unnamed protein product [Lathyrus oleraceus]|uniref:Dynein light chain n=1 Tax=Pisum sativum TaxID=3888 RepID=A0A9D5BMJ3_PEA|nr:uncharacterized protein LOC127073233 [Pisum sativum]KAI5446423.1 hypothetical protein KIW84_014307 [Pisum sativum]